MSNQVSLANLKPLTSTQYDEARKRALTRVQARIGDKPTRKQFTREMGSLFTLLDALALAVFVPALLVSSVHILQHMGALANASYPTIATYSAGTVIGRDLYTAIHQWATVPLAEASMLLFLVMFAMSARTWRKGVYFWLALAAILFVIVANVQSGLGLLESLLPPMFTVGIGVHLETLIVRQLQRREDVQTRYMAALEVWERSSADPTKHPDFMPLVRAEMWTALAKKNPGMVDAPVAFRHAAVRRELSRETWVYEDAPGGVETSAGMSDLESARSMKPGDEGDGAAESPFLLRPTPTIISKGTGNGQKRDGEEYA